MRVVLSLLLLLAGAVTLSAGWAGPLAMAAIAAATLIPYLVLLAGTRLRLPVPVSTLAVLVLISLAVAYTAATAGSNVTTLIRDAVPRLLTAARPAPAVPELLLPGVIFAAMVGTWAGVRAARPGGSRFAPVACAALLYLAGALLTAGQADSQGVLAAMIIVGAAATWSLPDRPRQFRATARTLAPAAVAATVALAATMVPSGGAFEPRHLVQPPPLPLLERNPLPRLAALAEAGDVELLRYNGPEVRLQLVALTDFDGVAWHAAPGYRPVGAVTSPAGLPAGPIRSTITADITITALDGLWLPTPGNPETVSLAEAKVDAETGSLALPQGLSKGLRYQVRGVVDTPSGTITVASVPAGTEYAGLPRLPFVFAEYVRGIVRGASTPFEQAVLIETALRERRLNHRAPAGSSYARLETFLFGEPGTAGGQEGTTEQFAAAFAVLARAAGLPSRVVAGFRTGDRDTDGARIVRGRHALAWPEVYFSGQGWVPFEPIPSTSDNSDPNEALRRQALDRVQQNQPPPVQTAPAPTVAPSKGNASPEPEALLPGHQNFPLAQTAASVIAVILIGLFAAVVLSRALRRLRHRRAGARGAWSEVLDLLVLLNRPPARWHTADRIAREIAVVLPAMQPHRLHRLAESADRAEFAPRGSAGTAATEAWADLHGLRRAARKAVPWYRGLLWWADPRPLLRR